MGLTALTRRARYPLVGCLLSYATASDRFSVVVNAILGGFEEWAPLLCLEYTRQGRGFAGFPLLFSVVSYWVFILDACLSRQSLEPNAFPQV